MTIRLQLLGGRQQRPSVGDLTDDLALPRQQLLERAEKQRVIVREQDAWGVPWDATLSRLLARRVLPARFRRSLDRRYKSADSPAMQNRHARNKLSHRNGLGVDATRKGTLSSSRRPGARLRANLERAADRLQAFASC